MLLTLKGLFSQNKNIFSHKLGYEWIEEHNHSFIEFFYLHSGSTSHYYNGKITKLQKGNACLLLPNDIHTFLKTDDNFIHRDITLRTEYFINICKQYRRDLYEDLINKKAPVFLIFPMNLLKKSKNDVFFYPFHLIIPSIKKRKCISRLKSSISSSKNPTRIPSYSPNG